MVDSDEGGDAVLTALEQVLLPAAKVLNPWWSAKGVVWSYLGGESKCDRPKQLVSWAPRIDMLVHKDRLGVQLTHHVRDCLTPFAAHLQDWVGGEGWRTTSVAVSPLLHPNRAELPEHPGAGTARVPVVTRRRRSPHSASLPGPRRRCRSRRAPT